MMAKEVCKRKEPEDEMRARMRSVVGTGVFDIRAMDLWSWEKAERGIPCVGPQRCALSASRM